MVKVLLIGTDAGSWNIIEPLIKEGKLPTFKRLMESGVWGDLESCIYYFTSPAWKCYSTGKNPGKLGVCGWWTFDKIDKKLSFVSSMSFKSRELWDILGECGYRSGVVNMPLTFPPKKTNGILISGVFSFGKGYAYPPKLEDMLGKYNYRTTPVLDIRTNIDNAILERKRLMKKRFSVSKRLLEESNYDFFQLVVFCTDQIQHVCWKHMEEGDNKYGNVIEDFWKLADSEIGKLLDGVHRDGDHYTFIISDHGATALRGIFGLNVWLRRKGYLHLRKKRTPSYRSLVPVIARLKRIMRKIPYRLLSKIDRKMFRENIARALTHDVDWQKTKAVCIGDNLIYLRTDGDVEALRNELIGEIRKLRNPKTGEKVVEDVKTKEEVFKGEYLSSLPDLIVIPKEGYRFAGFPSDRGTGVPWSFSRKHTSGWHRLNGIFLAHGPEIKNDKRIYEATIYDIVPTILHILGVPIPRDIDGRVLKEIFKEDSDLKKRPVAYEKKRKEKTRTEKEYYSREQEERMVERLRELGYL